MIFLLPENNPTLFVMMAEKDIATMREGHTITIDPRQLSPAFFNGLVVSLHASNEAAKEVLRGGGYAVGDNVVKPPVEPNDIKCDRCGGPKPGHMLFEGRCIVCWSAVAKEKA